MDFGFSEEQELLRGQARDFLDKQSAPAAVRRRTLRVRGNCSVVPPKPTPRRNINSA